MSDLNQLLRPKTWSRVMGQRDVKEICMTAIESNRFPKFSIFHGPTGVGKSCIAELVASSLVCTSKENRQCDICGACNPAKYKYVRKYNMAAMLGKKDIIEVLNDIFKFKALSDDRPTVFILEEVQVLKQKDEQTPFLEELTKIPDNVYIIMCTTKVYDLLPELRSRAMLFALSTPSLRDCVDYIQQICGRLGIPAVSDAAAEALATLAEYTPRSIVNYIELLATPAGVDEASILKLLKTISRHDYLMLLSDLVNNEVNLYAYVKHLHALGDKISYSKLSYGLRDVVLAILVEISLESPDKTMTADDRKLSQDILSRVSEGTFIKLLNSLCQFKATSFEVDKIAFLELIKLKMSMLELTTASAVRNNVEQCAVSRTVSTRNARVAGFTAAESTDEFTQLDASSALEDITGIEDIVYAED